MDHEPPTVLIILLSGPAAAGKTTTAHLLASQRCGQPDLVVQHVSTSTLLRQMIAGQAARDRGSLETAGAAINEATAGGWLVEAVTTLVDAHRPARRVVVVVDAVRRPEEVDAIRSQFSTSKHVHLKAPLDELAERFGSRRRDDDLRAGSNYKTVRTHPTEKLVPVMERLADEVIDTGPLSPSEVAARISALCGLGTNAEES